jgi:hypothetical protein
MEEAANSNKGRSIVPTEGKHLSPREGVAPDEESNLIHVPSSPSSLYSPAKALRRITKRRKQVSRDVGARRPSHHRVSKRGSGKMRLVLGLEMSARKDETRS